MLETLSSASGLKLSRLSTSTLLIERGKEEKKKSRRLLRFFEVKDSKGFMVRVRVWRRGLIV